MKKQFLKNKKDLIEFYKKEKEKIIKSPKKYPCIIIFFRYYSKILQEMTYDFEYIYLDDFEKE